MSDHGVELDGETWVHASASSPSSAPRIDGVRVDLLDAIERAWVHIASPGTWLSGAERLDVAREARGCADCATCDAIDAALSPASVTDAHVATTSLPANWVEAIHRIRRDAGRLTERWYSGLADEAFDDARYVELTSVVATISALDTFDVALGRALRPLPEPLPGEPSRRRPEPARQNIAWVPTLAPEDVTPGAESPWGYRAPEFVFHIHRALSLVPDEVRGFFDLDEALYLPQEAIRDFGGNHRAIDNAQIELLAARTSWLNRCTY